MADTPRVTVPVEPTEAMLDAWRKAVESGIFSQTPHSDYMRSAYRAMLSAAPAPEGGAVKGPGGYLVKDFADGWYWTPNAALDHASGAPVWSVADGRYETDPPALAAREEAPADNVTILITRAQRDAALNSEKKLNDWIGGILQRAVEEAPAEAGERDYPAEFEAWWATYRHRNRDVADYSVKKQIAFDAFYHAALRARSSAPEALGNLLAVIHRDGGHRAVEVGVAQAAVEAEKIVANLLSSAPEAREGEAVAEDAGRQAIWAVVHEVWQLLDDGETDSAGKTTVDQERWQAVSDAMDKLEALVPDSEGPFWGGFPVNYFWPKAAEVFPASGNNHPAAPSADKLRGLVGASEDILSALSALSVAGKPIASLDTKLRDAINTLVPALAALQAEQKGGA